MLELMVLAVNKNMIDRDEYPQTAEIERRGGHDGRPVERARAANTVGRCDRLVEARTTAGMQAKWRWRAKRSRPQRAS